MSRCHDSRRRRRLTGFFLEFGGDSKLKWKCCWHWQTSRSRFVIVFIRIVKAYMGAFCLCDKIEGKEATFVARVQA